MRESEDQAKKYLDEAKAFYNSSQRFSAQDLIKRIEEERENFFWKGWHSGRRSLKEEAEAILKIKDSK